MRFYSANELDVTLEPAGVNLPAAQMASSDSNDFGVIGADQILPAREKRAPIVTLAVIYRKSPSCYHALKKSGITKSQDLIEGRIPVRLGGNEDPTYRVMLQRAGIDSKRLAQGPVEHDLSSLFTDQIMAWPVYSISEPIAPQEQGYAVALWPGDSEVELSADILSPTESLIEEEPEGITATKLDSIVQAWSPLWRTSSGRIRSLDPLREAI